MTIYLIFPTELVHLKTVTLYPVSKPAGVLSSAIAKVFLGRAPV